MRLSKDRANALKQWALALMLAFAMISPDRAAAEASGPDFFRVVGVAANDVLNIRTGAGVDHAKIGEIPPDTDGVRNLGCVGGLNFEKWQSATAAERAAAAKTRWCQIEYRGTRGWVAGRYLAEGSAPAGPSTSEPGTLWRIVEVAGFAVEGDAEMGFRPDGSLYGSTGCNQFQGEVSVEGNRLDLAGPLAVTRMACPDARLDAQEREILLTLESRPTLSFDPLTDEMLLTGFGEQARIRLSRKN